MLYKVISAHGVKIYPTEEAYLEEKASLERQQEKIKEITRDTEEARTRRRHQLRTEAELRAAYMAGDIEAWDLEAGLNELYGLHPSTPA